MITPCLSNEFSKKWGPPLATPVRKICAAGDNGASRQSAAKCAVTLTSAGTAPAVAKSAIHARNTFLAGQDFDLEVIEIMSAAFVSACDAMHLKIGDPAARFVAEKVI